jgi:hypothetical protein
MSNIARRSIGTIVLLSQQFFRMLLLYDHHVTDFHFLGLIRVELMTPSLSEKCSNRLSYKPVRNRKPLSKLINFYIKKVKGKKSRLKRSLNGLVVRLRLVLFVTIALCKVLEDLTQNSVSRVFVRSLSV